MSVNPSESGSETSGLNICWQKKCNLHLCKQTANTVFVGLQWQGNSISIGHNKKMCTGASLLLQLLLGSDVYMHILLDNIWLPCRKPGEIFIKNVTHDLHYKCKAQLLQILHRCFLCGHSGLSLKHRYTIRLMEQRRHICSCKQRPK